MDLEEAIYKRRTIRRFTQEPIPRDTLKKLIDYGRVAPMGNNIQSIEFIIVSDPEMRQKIFPLTAWAGSLPKDQRLPEEGRRPTAYIVVLVNTEIKKNADADEAAAVENILLGAVSQGIGTCWMGSINRPQLRKLLEIPEKYEIKHLISLGYPDEESVMESYEGSFKYWKDEQGKMHVPKRSLDEVIFKEF
ncbi:MAG: nitroreductase [Promethearchaeota archaeon]|nr:MAG: nitroreductase [Candidatus Lokiarchaeota archaeon]